MYINDRVFLWVRTIPNPRFLHTDSTISNLYFPRSSRIIAPIYIAMSDWTVPLAWSLWSRLPHVPISFSLFLFFPLFHPYAAHSYASSRLLAATRVHFTLLPAVYQPLPTSHISDRPIWSLSREAARRAGHRYTTWHKNKGLHAATCIVQTTYPKFITQISCFLDEREWTSRAENISSRFSIR